MKKSFVKNKKQFQRLETQRAKLLEYLLSDIALIQGSYTELRVKCGKAGCHCEKKPAHLVARLGTRENGKVLNKVVRIADREEVLQLVEHYKKHRNALREIVKIHQQQKNLIKKLIDDKNQGYQ